MMNLSDSTPHELIAAIDKIHRDSWNRETILEMIGFIDQTLYKSFYPEETNMLMFSELLDKFLETQSVIRKKLVTITQDDYEAGENICRFFESRVTYHRKNTRKFHFDLLRRCLHEPKRQITVDYLLTQITALTCCEQYTIFTDHMNAADKMDALAHLFTLSNVLMNSERFLMSRSIHASTICILNARSVRYLVETRNYRNYAIDPHEKEKIESILKHLEEYEKSPYVMPGQPMRL
jgi:hypothetical protein